MILEVLRSLQEKEWLRKAKKKISKGKTLFLKSVKIRALCGQNSIATKNGRARWITSWLHCIWDLLWNSLTLLASSRSQFNFQVLICSTKWDLGFFQDNTPGLPPSWALSYSCCPVSLQEHHALQAAQCILSWDVVCCSGCVQERLTRAVKTRLVPATETE